MAGLVLWLTRHPDNNVISLKSSESRDTDTSYNIRLLSVCSLSDHVIVSVPIHTGLTGQHSLLGDRSAAGAKGERRALNLPSVATGRILSIIADAIDSDPLGRERAILAITLRDDQLRKKCFG
jgi:hypothetical protein